LEVPVEGFASLAKRTGAVLGVQMVEQNLQEGFQDAMPLLVQEVGSFISEAVPGVDGKKELAEYAKGRVDTFWALLPMVLIGTGSATFSDAAFGRQYFNDVRALKAVGFTDEAVTKIMEAPSLEEKQAVMKSMWSDEQMRVMNGVAQQAAFADLDADMQASYIEQGSGEGAQIRRLEDGMFEVTTPDGELLDNTSSPDAALELARDWNAADQLNETAAIEDMIGYVESFQEAGQSIELMDKSKTLQDRVDAGDFTQEEADGIVQLYTEMGRLNEGATPGSVLITGENEVTKYDARRRIVSDVSRIYDGASPLTVVEEHAEGYLKRRLADGSVTLEDIVRWRKSTGSTVTDASERALIEWFSEQSQAYLVGKSNAEALPATFRQFLSKLRKYLGKILDLSVRLMDLEASGKMDGNFKTHLARSVGLDQAHIDAQMRAEEVGQMDGRGTELMGWLKGKLPHPDTAKANGEQLAGELATVWEGFKSPQAARAFFAPKGVYTPLDQLAGMARDDGFPFETADDLLKAIDSSLRGEEVFADAGTGATFSLSDSRAKPEDASNVTVLPDGAQLVGPTTFSLTAYHGTPHKVDKFSMDKIGTGEGAQAYGWGLYFAENKAVGEEYRRSLSDNMLSRDVLKEYFKEGAIIPSYGGMDRVVKLNLGVDVANWSVDVQAVVPDGKGGWKKESDYGTGIRNHSTYPSPKNLDKLGIKRGNLYTVELLPDADDFLDWDKPLREQSDKVKEALAKVDNRLVKALAEVAAGGRPRDVAVSHGVNVIDLYLGSGGAMVQTLGGDAAASKTLAAAGIPGIRYLDGASRGKGGTSNYVIFDESLVKIIEENGKKVEQAGATFSPADISAKWEARGIKNQVSEKGGVITLSSIRVSDTEQAQGLGTAAMKELTAYADKSGQMIALTPSVDFGASSVGRLRDFYKRFGFVENKGRNKDFRVRETMIREAKKGGKADITMGMESLDRANEIKAVMRKHKIAARVAAADHQGEAFSPEMRKAMEDRLYRVVPNKETVAEALKVVTEKGVGNALELVLSRTSTLTPNVQVALGMALMEHFNAKKQFEKAIEVGERVNELGTELGRGVQAFSLLGNVLDTPEKAQIFLSNKLKSLEAALRERKPVIDASKEVLANVQEEALKLLEKWLDEINGVSGKPMASRKAVRTEDLPDITFALSQDVRKSGIVSVVARMLKESGAAETRKALVEKYGDKVAPHVADILIEAQKQLTAKAAAKKAKPKVDKPGAAAEDKGKDRSGPRMSEEEIDNALAEIHATGRKVGFQDQMVAIEEHFQGKRMTDAQIEDTLALGRAMGIGGTTTTLEGFDDLVKRFEDEVINRLKVKGHDAPKSLRDAVRKLFETKGVKFTREDIARVFAEKFKVPKATETQNKRLVELAENIRSTPEFSTARTDATVELMNHVNEILKPVDWVDIGWSLWYANVLSGYNTHFRNLYANTLEQMVSLPLEAMRANPVKTLQLMREMLYGVKAGASIGLAEAKNQLKTGEASVLQTESNKFGSSGTLERVDFAGGQANPFNWLKVVGRALRAEDLFAYATAQEAKARMVAWEMADAKGLIGAERQAEVEKLLNATDEQIGDFAERAAREWDGLSDELKAKGNREQWEARRVKELRLLERDGALIERASEFAARATFNYKPDGFVGLMANSLIDVMNGLGRADTTGQAEVVQKALMTAPKLVVPFVRIVANVLNRGIDYTGMGIARSAFETKRVGAAAGKNGFVAKSADERAMELKRGIFGIVALGVLSSLANPDDPEAEIQIHGSGAGSREKNQALNGPRWMPYSIEFRGKEGSKFYTFQYSPLLMGLALVGNYHDAKRYRKLDEKDLTERLAVAAAGVGSVLLDQSFLSNAADLVNMFGRDGQVSQNALYSFMGRTFNPSTVAIPFSSLLRQLERDFDPVQRSKPDIKAALFSNVPVAARANDPALDILGDAIANRPFDWLARASVDGTPEARIYRAFGAKDLVPTSVWSYKGKMEPEQFYQFTKERGALLKESLMRNDAAFLKLIESSNEEVAAKILENLSRSATQMARVRVGYFPEVKTKTK
jgi:GNAT superfamily N-acetyltransferase